MEIQIDTSLLSQHSNFSKTNNIIKIEESVTYEIANFVNDNSNLKDSSFKPNFLIKIEYFSFENTEDKCLTVYGIILDNNQQFYEYDISDKIFIFTKNVLIIDRLITNFLKITSSLSHNFDGQFSLRFEIEECLVINNKYLECFPQSKEIDRDFTCTNRNLILFKLIFLSSCIKLFFAVFKKFKFNKWENILINSNNYEEAFLFSKILNLIGYEVFINLSGFNSIKNYTKDDFIINEELAATLVNLNNSNSNNNTFNYVIDTTSDSLKSSNKIKSFSLLKFDGKLIILDSKNSANNRQLDPRDIEYISNKNINLCFNNTVNCLRFNQTVGRELNFIVQIFEKLIPQLSNDNNVKILLKKLDCKIINTSENIRDISIDEIMSSKNFINIYLI